LLAASADMAEPGADADAGPRNATARDPNLNAFCKEGDTCRVTFGGKSTPGLADMDGMIFQEAAMPLSPVAAIRAHCRECLPEPKGEYLRCPTVDCPC